MLNQRIGFRLLSASKLKGDVMKKMIMMLMFVLLTVIPMSGCVSWFSPAVNYATNMVDLKAESTLIKKQYERVYLLIEKKQSGFTDEEWVQLNDIHFAFSETADRISEMLSDPTKVVTPKELKGMYELAYIGYANARDIISVHKDEFTAYSWSQMINFDKQAIEYDKQVRAVLDNPDNNDINMTLGIIITLGGAAYKYLLPVLVSLI